MLRQKMEVMVGWKAVVEGVEEEALNLGSQKLTF
jgi:hypothetical protein